MSIHFYKSLKIFKNSKGMTLIEILIVAGVMSIMMLAVATIQQQQMKSNSFIEFQAKKEQLRLTLLGQFLNDPNNCKCLFRGSNEFAEAGTVELKGVAPTEVGRYNFSIPGDCSTATMPAPFITSLGIDNLKTTAIGLKNILNIGGAYSGEMTLNLQTTKEVLGPKDLVLKIPVAIRTNIGSAPGTVAFVSCSTAGGSSGGLDFSPTLSGSYTWQIRVLKNNGGYGTSKGSPALNLAKIGMYGCGPIQEINLSSFSSILSSSKAAIISFYSGDNSAQSPAVRVFTTDNEFVGLIGQAGRNSGGQAHGGGGELIIPLENKKFKIQSCRRIGVPGDQTTWYYTVKAVLN